jgi:hypothetical protein
MPERQRRQVSTKGPWPGLGTRLLHAYSGQAHVVTASIGERHRSGAELAIEIVAIQSSDERAISRPKHSSSSRLPTAVGGPKSSKSRN